MLALKVPTRHFAASLLLWTICARLDGQILEASFEAGKAQVAAFVVGDGKMAVTLGVAGRDLDEARLSGASGAVAGMATDPVSRLVVFRAEKSFGQGLPLAPVSPLGGSLKLFGKNPAFRVEARVEQVGGKFLPFTLLRLRHQGQAPRAGTPLLDLTGRVAAVIHQPAGEGAVYAIPVEVLHRALEFSHEGEIERVWLGLVMKPGKGPAKIERVIPGSPAAQAGLQAGDQLLQLGNKRLFDYGDAVNAFYLLRPGKRQSLKVRRAALEIVTELTPILSK